MKKLIFIASCMLCATVFTFGQTLQDARQKTEDERYEEATRDFLTLIQQSPDDIDNYFYLAENYLQMNKLDSAKYYWKKASVDVKNPLSIVADGKVLWVEGKTTEAIAKFDEAIKISRKRNGEVYRQIGAILIEANNKDLDRAISYLTIATEVDPKSVEGYLLLGDAIIEKDPKNGTDAIRQYNNAEKIQQSAKTIVRKAKLYQRARNYQLANDMYLQAQALEPKYAPAYRAHANLQELFGKYDLAIENWKKYLALNDNNYARYQYAAALYSAKKSCEALEEVNKLEAKNYSSLYIERIEVYAIYDCLVKDDKVTDSVGFKQGLQKSENFIKKYGGTKDMVGMDYQYYGNYLLHAGENQEAIKAYEEAAKDSTITKDVTKLLAKIYTNAGDFTNAIGEYNKIIAMDSSALSLSDYFELGRIYFLNKDYVNADKANAYVLKLAPNYSFSFFWRARANVFMELDKEPKDKKWLAKDFYEGYLNNTTDQEKAQYKAMTIEAYKYLGDYYVNSPEKDITKAKEVWSKIVELDPDNEGYKAILAKLEKSK